MKSNILLFCLFMFATTFAKAEGCMVENGSTSFDKSSIGQVAQFGDLRIKYLSMSYEKDTVSVDIKAPGFEKRDVLITPSAPYVANVCNREITITINFGAFKNKLSVSIF